MYRPLSGSAPSINSWLDVQSAIRGLTQDFATAFNTGNYDHAATLFTSDGFLMPPQREEIGGYTAAIHQANRTTVVERGKFVHTWRRLGIWRMAANCWNSDLPAAR